MHNVVNHSAKLFLAWKRWGIYPNTSINVIFCLDLLHKSIWICQIIHIWFWLFVWNLLIFVNLTVFEWTCMFLRLTYILQKFCTRHNVMNNSRELFLPQIGSKMVATYRRTMTNVHIWIGENSDKILILNFSKFNESSRSCGMLHRSAFLKYLEPLEIELSNEWLHAISTTRIDKVTAHFAWVAWSKYLYRTKYQVMI